jgi:hypothetical protein
MVVAACLSGFLLASVAGAQADSASWENTFALYGWGTGIDGDMTLGPVASSASVDFDQILGALELAAMARYRGQAERWAFVVDGIFAGLGGTHEGALRDQELDFDEIVVQADVAWRRSRNVEFLLGVRYVRLQTTLDTSTLLGGEVRRENDATFIDPVVGLRLLGTPGERLRLQAQADVGGGAGLDLTWQAMLNLGWQATDSLSLWLGYRAIGMDFDDSGARNRFSADLVSHGPILGTALRF